MSRGFKLIALFSLAMLQWALILAACPELHELVHHDADEEHHDCVVTAILAGGVEQISIASVLTVRPAGAFQGIDLSFDPQPFTPFFLICRILEHAPPVLT